MRIAFPVGDRGGCSQSLIGELARLRGGLLYATPLNTTSDRHTEAEPRESTLAMHVPRQRQPRQEPGPLTRGYSPRGGYADDITIM